VAEEAARANLGYSRYLLALAEGEVAQRDRNQQLRCIHAAHFPVLKELSDFDFSAVPSLHKARVLDLARGEYITKAENLILLGGPGLAVCRRKDNCSAKLPLGRSLFSQETQYGHV
jgi:DNA replication protein DnaC